jgi:uracil phosphoribosyltransferase
MIREIGKDDSIFNRFLSELRDATIQQDSLRFRRNLERLGELFAYEISKTFTFKEVEVITPLGVSMMRLPREEPIIAAILRAALPLHKGLLNYFDRAESAFVSAYRKYSKDENFIIKLDYISAPPLKDRILIVCDPMLATGGSLLASLEGLLEKGTPSHIHVVAALASDEGVAKVKKRYSLKNMTLWIGAIDDELTAQAYIVPGLGDAGDLAYGKKDD